MDVRFGHAREDELIAIRRRHIEPPQRRPSISPDEEGDLSMPDRTESTIVIGAPPAAVLDVIADFEAYPEWAEQVKTVSVLSEDGDGWDAMGELQVD